MKARTLFSPFFRPLFGDTPRPEPGDTPGPDAALPPSRTLHDVESELEKIAQEAEAQRLEAATKAAIKAAEEGAASAPGGEVLSEVARTAARQRAWKAERDALRARLGDEIAGLHSSLGTGISREALPHLGLVLATHDPAVFAKPGATIEEQIEGSVLALLSRRTGERAWERLNELMVRSGVSWPTPDGLDEFRSEEELRIAMDQHYKEVRNDFLDAAAARLAGLVSGEVSAWKYCYPPTGCYLWRQTALRGVAAGLRGQLFGAALETWAWRPADVETRLLATLDAALRSARQILEAERGSLQAAVDAAARVAEVSRTVVPNAVWEYVEPRLSWDGPGLTELALADGLETFSHEARDALTPGRG